MHLCGLYKSIGTRTLKPFNVIVRASPRPPDPEPKDLGPGVLGVSKSVGRWLRRSYKNPGGLRTFPREPRKPWEVTEVRYLALFGASEMPQTMLFEWLRAPQVFRIMLFSSCRSLRHPKPHDLLKALLCMYGCGPLRYPESHYLHSLKPPKSKLTLFALF